MRDESLELVKCLAMFRTPTPIDYLPVLCFIFALERLHAP
jgi:hypothetical protein